MIEYSKVLDRFSQCEHTGKNFYTDFLDPLKSERFFSALLQNDSGITVLSYGGNDECERKMLGFSYDPEFSYNDFPISVIKCTRGKMGRELSHRDYLGSMLSLGILRERVGDIFCRENIAYFFVQNDIADYILANMERIGSVGVKVSLLSKDSPEIFSIDKSVEVQINVPSMRLDACLSAVFKLSRQEASSFIASEKVLVNWQPITNPSKDIKIGDTVTCRQKGRFKILSEDGKTKKDRIVLSVSVLGRA